LIPKGIKKIIPVSVVWYKLGKFGLTLILLPIEFRKTESREYRIRLALGLLPLVWRFRIETILRCSYAINYAVYNEQRCLGLILCSLGSLPPTLGTQITIFIDSLTLDHSRKLEGAAWGLCKH
jgi:hypothetical protein